MSISAQVMPPLLREGDRLTRDEFMRRWEAMPDVKWAELIDGVVHMPSPLTNIHGDFQARLNGWLVFYVAATPGCSAVANATCLINGQSVPQPDLALKIFPEQGGQSCLEGKYAAGAPELIVEISHTTTTRDSGIKKRLYEQSGVREYLIVKPQKQQIVWYELVEGKYREVQPGEDALYRSRVFPGLWLKAAALWNCAYPALSAAVQQATETAEHAEFVSRLARAKS